jgi:hypothetical protein
MPPLHSKENKSQVTVRVSLAPFRLGNRRSRFVFCAFAGEETWVTETRQAIADGIAKATEPLKQYLLVSALPKVVTVHVPRSSSEIIH